MIVAVLRTTVFLLLVFFIVAAFGSMLYENLVDLLAVLSMEALS